MRANRAPAAKLNGELATATSCPFVGSIVKHQIAKLDPVVTAYTKVPLGSTVIAVGPVPFVAVKGEPRIVVNSPLPGSMLKAEILPMVVAYGEGLVAEGFAT